MQQNNANYQNGQGNTPNHQNVPDNPYTQYYRQYFADPEKAKNEVPKPRRVASIVLCAVSTIVLVYFFAMWLILSYENINFKFSFDTGAGSGLAGSFMLLLMFLPGTLIPAIIAKVLNRKSIWALINIVCICIMFVAVIVVGIFLPAWSQKYNQTNRTGDTNIADDWNRDVEELLEDYSFDVADIDEEYTHLKGDPFEVRIFVSSEASQAQIDELNDFLIELRDLDKDSRYRIVIKVYPCYYEPGNNSSFVYTPRYRIEYDSSSDEIDIEESLYDDLENRRRVPGHVPEELEQGNLLIVVR